MSQVLGDRQTLRRKLHFFYAPIEAQLADVERTLTEEIGSDYPAIDELLKHGFSLGGKRLRPALLLLSGKAVGSVSREHQVLAAVVEMIHTATLVHDDVLDEATLRRYRQTVNARWSNESSVLLGDYLFSHAFYLASTLDTTYGCRVIGRATNIVCEGELRQVSSRGNFDLSEEAYLSIIEAKTGELCACCCQLGAHYAGADAALVAAMARFGRDLGVAFQIADDLLDVLGDEPTTGKSLGTDLEKQKMTLPLIRLLDQVSPAERAELVEVLAGPAARAREVLSEWFARTDALSYAREVAQSLARRGVEELASLARNDATSALEAVAEFVVSRRL
ncbi:MAG: polyprenyl synthetase family protein [Pirellulales bacterium]|nr:polyprenyl synthetase family protein [Pirellulales bacterium]